MNEAGQEHSQAELENDNEWAIEARPEQQRAAFGVAGEEEERYTSSF
jgi:hypothetical protein